MMMSRSEIREYLIGAVAQVSGVDPISVDPTCPFHDFGLTSSDAVSLSGELEERLERRLAPTLLYDHPTIDALADALAAPSADRLALAHGDPAPAACADTEPGNHDDDPICVVGLGCRFPGAGDGPAGFWGDLVAGVDAGREVPADRWDGDAYFDPTPGAAGKSYTKRGGFLPDLAGFDAAFFGISPAEALRMDPQQRMVLEVAWSALEHAGIAADRIRGSRTGVFVGMMASQEYARLQADCDGDACFDDPFFAYGVAPSVTAGRLSYALDLRGPSLCVDTACSSSLLTVHLAKESLRRGECDLAVAGGVSAIVHPGAMVQACHAHMLAGDGSCKTFDERADGFMMGEGCGFVVLERRSDALARGHSVLAVLRGSAVNQDGRTNGPTAPSQDAQAGVIRAAIADAGVTPGAIDYVEAHGSGTRLGDAIELGALQEVFAADREPDVPLLVGAVKTNVGHLLGAAGVAGLIKTVLAVQAGTIPANQNLHTPTAALDWDQTPLAVPGAATRWPDRRPTAPARLAGVSSFGWSGTNVHVVVEQSTPETRETTAEPVAAFPISARTETALASAAAGLAEHVARLADGDLLDAAFTLQTGRSALEWRAAPVGHRPADAASALRAVAAGSAGAYVAPGAPNAPVFLFPGTGDQYPGMGQELYESDDAFRRAFDACADAALPLVGVDLRAHLRVGAPLDRTDLVHTAVFSIEYALARMLESWGIAPAAMIGYSLGEYAAAAVAGVFSAADAVLLVARRAQLIAGTPTGGMVAVAAPAADVRRLLPPGVGVAAVNGPAMTVASGPAAGIQALRRTLADHGIAHMPIATGHALHSSLLDPIREPLEAVVGSLERHAPRIPFVSGATGAWIEPEQARDPAYWGAQMVEPVRFADGLSALGATPAASWIEVGPGQTLTGLARQALVAAGRSDLPVTATLSPLVPAVAGERERLLRAAAAHWTAGGHVAWEAIHPAGQRRVRRLPTYPFEHQRFWPEGEPVVAADAEARAPLAETLRVPAWTCADAPAPGDVGGPVLIVSDPQRRGTGLAHALAEQLPTAVEVIEAVAGPAFAERADGRFELRAGDLDDHRMLAERLAATGRLPRTVVHLWGVGDAGGDAVTPRESIHRDRVRGFDSLVALTRALAGAGAGTTRLVAVTDHMQDVTGTENLAPGKAAVLGACLVVGQEYPAFSCLSVDIDPQAGVDAAAKALAVELTAPAATANIAYRDGVRYEAVFTPHAGPDAGPKLRDEGVYLLTGGLGNVGLLLAEHLARRVRAPRIVLTGRRGLPPRSEWPGLLSGDERSPDAERVERVQAIEELGAEVLVLAADAADPGAMRRVVNAARERYGTIHGVIHGAGLTGRDQFEPVEMATAATTEAHFTAKLESLCALDEALGDAPLDYCVLQSSMSAILGGVGFAAYSAANAVLDAYAAAQRRAGRPWTSVNWDTWAPTAARNEGASLNQFSMPTEEALAAFERVLAAERARVVVAVGDLAARIAQWVGPQAPGLGLPAPQAERAPARAFPRPALGEAYVPAASRHERRLAELWQEALGVDRVGVNDNFFDLGGNSLLGLQLVRRLAEEYERNVPAVALFEAPTIRALARYLAGDGEEEAPSAAEAELARRREAARAAGSGEPIAIIGLAARFPGAGDVTQFWDNLRDGVESVTVFTDEEMLAAGVPPELLQSEHYVRARPVLEGVDRFDAGFFGYSPREAQFTDPQHRVFLECAWTALEDAGYAPRSHPGSVGVFAGANISTYLRYLHEVGALDGGLSDYETVIGNDKDALTTTVSYKLDLTGPSLGVQTFCSTSLVAVHLAAQTLRVGECDMALAGGVSVRVPDRIGHLFVPGGMECPDGHVRAFDAAASGTMFGDGAGVVVLKRLSDAIADGDPIRAVIRGSAVNNDGSLKVGFTAPSVEGQAEVVTRAQHDAGVEPETISYIEAHGTGTPLGDPIEVTALTRAFGPGPTRQACPIGSVKTNVGHLDRAAGISGLIKTVLSLQHRQIPATLHFERPNPQIDFTSTPFYVNTALAPWEPPPGIPRRAGINSLGMGGTNVHVVLEEAPAPAPPPSGTTWARPTQLLVLSAATPAALDQATANLANFLRAHPDADLADVAYTLQVGRETFEYRRVVVCSTVTDAVAALEGEAPALVLTRRERVEQRPVAFMFDGVGEQYPGLAAELYDSEPLFRGVVDECAAVVDPLLGVDVRGVLFGGGSPDDGRAALDLSALLARGGDADAELDPLARTQIAQPAVFILEYALARLLLSWGVRPEAVAGYSVGEYVAATIAGRLRLADALALVAERAQLIDALPRGAMLAVAAPAAELAPWCGDELDLAAVNAPAMSVLAGPEGPINALTGTLAGAGIACRRLDTTHAFHSRMLAPVAEAVTAFVHARVPMSAPEIPCASNVTGTWITPDEATDPAYWARHMCEPVRFADVAGALLEDPDRMLVEIGPGQTLGTFVRQHPDCEPARTGLIVGTLPARHDPTGARDAVHATLGRLWLAGVAVDWEAHHAGERRRRVSLPTYPFQRDRYWIDPPEGYVAGAGRALPAAGCGAACAADPGSALAVLPRTEPNGWLYLPAWRQAAPPVPAELEPGDTWLVLADAAGVADAFAARLNATGLDPVVVTAGDGFHHTGVGRYALRPGNRDDYQRLVEALGAAGTLPSKVALLWGLDEEPATPADAHAWLIDRCYLSPLWLGQSLGPVAPENAEVIVASTGAYNITGADRVRPESATAAGPCKVIPLEFTHTRWRQVDVPAPDDAAQAAAIAGWLLDETGAAATDTVTAWRGGRRWLPAYEPLTAAGEDHGLRPEGVYVITGGLGGIGLAIAERMARDLAARLVLVTRTELPPRAAWAELAADEDSGSAGERVRAVLELEAAGAEVLVVTADVTDAAAVRAALDATRRRFGRIDGVIHAAGVPGMGLVQLRTADDADAALRPKVAGTRALLDGLRGFDVGLLVLFSSITSLTGGGPGQVDYCAANAYLDAVAQGAGHGVQRVVSIDWSEWEWNAWADGLAGYAPAVREFFEDHRRRFGISFDEGWQTLGRALAAGQPQVVVSTQDFRRVAELAGRFTIGSVLAFGRDSGERHARPDLDTPYVAPGTDAERVIAELWCDALGLTEVGIHDNFFELGGNSLLGVELVARTCRQLEREAVPPHVLYLAPTVSGLAQLVTGEQRDEWVDDRRERGASRRGNQRRRRQREHIGS